MDEEADAIMRLSPLLELSLYIDLLSVHIESGRDFTSALGEVSNLNTDSVTCQRFQRLLAHIRIGKPKGDAMRLFQSEWRHPAVDTLCETLLHAWKHGISIRDILKEQADSLRQELTFQMEREIHILQLKLLLPLFILVVPAVLIVLATPLLLALTTHLNLGG